MNTLKDSKPGTPGEMQSDVEIKSEYTWATEGWPSGKCKIYTKVYDHLVPGKEGHIKLVENEHDFEIILKAG